MRRFLLISCLFLMLSACATDPYTGQSTVAKTGIGTGVGALAGAGLGALVGGQKGALIGAGIGAAGGAAVGGYMDLQARALRQELEGTGVRVVKQGNTIRLIMPGNITFDTDKAEIKPSFYPVLDSVAKVLLKYDKTQLKITGYTDNTGSLAHNKELSLRRATAVETYLRSRQIPYTRLQVSGMGPADPVASNDTPQGREQNRRVEIKIIDLVS